MAPYGWPRWPGSWCSSVLRPWIGRYMSLGDRKLISCSAAPRYLLLPSNTRQQTKRHPNAALSIMRYTLLPATFSSRVPFRSPKRISEKFRHAFPNPLPPPPRPFQLSRATPPSAIAPLLLASVTADKTSYSMRYVRAADSSSRSRPGLTTRVEQK